MDPVPSEKRSRSRSKTPFLRSNCDNEECTHAEGEHHDKKKTLIRKNTSKAVISEEIIVVEKNRSKIPKIRTSDYSSEEISPEFIKTQAKTNLTKNIKIDTVTKNVSNSFKEITSTQKQASFSEIKEINQNESNLVLENLKLSTSTPLRISKQEATSTTKSLNGDVSNHLAYKFYKDAGEYWNKYPKTDYTYSKLSPYRREIAPGVIAMPNMSRRSLEKHNERIDAWIKKNPLHETYIRDRYEGSRQHKIFKSQNIPYYRNNLYYDSQDELDISDVSSFSPSFYNMGQRRNTNLQKYGIIRQFFGVFLTFFSSIWSVFWDQSYYTRVERNQGINIRRSPISFLLLGITKVLYGITSTVLYFDVWLLKSSSRDAQGKKRYLLFLLILLPFLLLTGLYYYYNPSEFFPPIKFNTLTRPIEFDNLKNNIAKKIYDTQLTSEAYLTYLKSFLYNTSEEIGVLWMENFSSQ